jgi:hypothetical protein
MGGQVHLGDGYLVAMFADLIYELLDVFWKGEVFERPALVRGHTATHAGSHPSCLLPSSLPSGNRPVDASEGSSVLEKAATGWRSESGDVMGGGRNKLVLNSELGGRRSAISRSGIVITG